MHCDLPQSGCPVRRDGGHFGTSVTPGQVTPGDCGWISERRLGASQRSERTIYGCTLSPMSQ